MPRRSMVNNAVWVCINDAQLLAMREPLWTGCGIAARAAMVNALFNGRRRWCGGCVQNMAKVCRNHCATMVPGRDWCGSCVGEQKGFCAVDCYRERLLDRLSYVGFYEAVLNGAPENPCSWCSRGAGSWCESCDRNLGPAAALCHRCDDTLLACRLCWASNYVRECGRVRAPRDAARRYAGSRVCGRCGATCVSASMLCGGCKTVAYCSLVCQRRDWKGHKPVCAMLQNAIPVFWVYEWQTDIVEELRDWTVTAGPKTVARFYECFGNNH